MDSAPKSIATEPVASASGKASWPTSRRRWTSHSSAHPLMWPRPRSSPESESATDSIESWMTGLTAPGHVSGSHGSVDLSAAVEKMRISPVRCRNRQPPRWGDGEIVDPPAELDRTGQGRVAQRHAGERAGIVADHEMPGRQDDDRCHSSPGRGFESLCLSVDE